MPLDTINEVCQLVLDDGISRSIYDEQVYNAVNFAENEFNKKNTSQKEIAGIEAAGTVAVSPSLINQYNEVGYSMGKSQAHGGAAEYANTVIDRYTGKFKSSQIGGDNAKNGADRVSAGFGKSTLIQCKYCKTASATIHDAFDNHDYGLNMEVEVPRDQYADGLKILQKKIDNGEYSDKGIKPGDSAEKYLRKGKITYNQSLRVAQSGSIEGLAVDAMAGVFCSSGAAGITALLSFATCKWNGMSTKDAAFESLKSGASVMGKGTAIYVISMQLGGRSEFINLFEHSKVLNQSTGKMETVFGGINNPFYKIGNSLATKINASDFAKTELGKSLKLDKINGQAIISGTVVVVITFGPDIVRALRGRISVEQLLKNSAVGGAGMAGAAIGNVLIPIPIVGSMIGGAATSFIVKKALDHFIEDDAVKMFQILKEEFIDAISLAGLTKDEMDKVVSLTIAHPKISRILKDMYAYGDSREYAREKIMDAAIESVYKEREYISDDMFENGYLQLCI